MLYIQRPFHVAYLCTRCIRLVVFGSCLYLLIKVPEGGGDRLLSGELRHARSVLRAFRENHTIISASVARTMSVHESDLTICGNSELTPVLIDLSTGETFPWPLVT